MAELVDAQDLKSCSSNTMPVRFRLRAIIYYNVFNLLLNRACLGSISCRPAPQYCGVHSGSGQLVYLISQQKPREANNEPTQSLSRLCDGLPRYPLPRVLFQLRANPIRRRNECWVLRKNRIPLCALWLRHHKNYFIYTNLVFMISCTKKVLHFDGIIIYSHG